MQRHSVLADVFCSKLKGLVPPACRKDFPFCRDRALLPTAGFCGEEAAVLSVLHREQLWPPEPSGKKPTAHVGEGEVAAGLEPSTQGKVSTQTQRLMVR